jgi:hypothetical protein
MEPSKKEPEEKLGFSFEPETLGLDGEGKFVVTSANHYTLLMTASLGSLAYTAKDNKYWLAPDKECPRDLLESKFLPYLRWKFDVLEDEIVPSEREDASGRAVKVSLKTGRKISKFPPTPENISAKRSEMLAAAFKAGKTADQAKIYAETSPVEMLEHEDFDALLDKSNLMQRLARRINR